MNEELKKRIDEMVNENKVFLFMKGEPDMPMCGFSFRVARILNDNKAIFGFFNILEDMEMREAVKEYTDWPTYPQLYINGKFIGGCEIVEDLEVSGELKKLLEA